MAHVEHITKISKLDLKLKSKVYAITVVHIYFSAEL